MESNGFTYIIEPRLNLRHILTIGQIHSLEQVTAWHAVVLRCLKKKGNILVCFVTLQSLNQKF